MPAPVTDAAVTNTSLPPSSGEMKPKPFAALKNLTVPFGMIFPVALRMMDRLMDAVRRRPDELEEEQVYSNANSRCVVAGISLYFKMVMRRFAQVQQAAPH